MTTKPSTFKKILVGVAMVIATIGIILCATIIVFAWAYNTPVTDSLVQVAEGAERVLVAADNGLVRVNNGLTKVYGAVSIIDGAARVVGERIVDTNIAFNVLERTVGDTLFPRVVAARETVSAVVDTVLGINDALEAANRLPFVEVPTLSTELQAVADRMDTAQSRVEEIQTEIRTIKEEKVARPVAFITDRTSVLIAETEEALTKITNARTRIAVALDRLAGIRVRIPRLIDLISLTITAIMLWLLGTQGYVLIHAFEYIRGKKIDWRRAAGEGEGDGTTIESVVPEAAVPADVDAEAAVPADEVPEAGGLADEVKEVAASAAEDEAIPGADDDK